jgi:hypothetical protein
MLLNSNERDDSRATGRRRDLVSRSSQHVLRAVAVIREVELHGRVIDRRSWLAGGRPAVRGTELPGRWDINHRQFVPVAARQAPGHLEALTIARIPALIASGKSGHAATTAAKSGSSRLRIDNRPQAFSLAVWGRIEPDSFGQGLKGGIERSPVEVDLTLVFIGSGRAGSGTDGKRRRPDSNRG